MTKWVRFFLIANIVIFFAQMTMGDAFMMAFAFKPRYALREPWTILTYMFLHGGLGHLFFNMLGLYFFGSRVEDRLGSDRFVMLYFISGITGGLLSFVFARNAAVIGASGAIYGIMLAYAWFWPRDRIMIYGIIPVEARILVIIYAVMSLMQGGGIAGGGGNTAHFAHLGGLVGAFVYLWYINKNQGAKKFHTKVIPMVPDTRLLNWHKVDTKNVHEINREELDRILDKINRSGLDSLSADERQFLTNFVPPDDRPPMIS